MGMQEYYCFSGVGGSLGFCSVFSNNFFVVTYIYLSLVLAIDFCYSQLMFFCILFKKDTKIKKQKKRWNILKKMNSLKKGEWLPLLNFEGGAGVPLLNFEGGAWVPLFNFDGGLGSRVPGSWSHFYTMASNWSH